MLNTYIVSHLSESFQNNLVKNLQKGGMLAHIETEGVNMFLLTDAGLGYLKNYFPSVFTDKNKDYLN